MKALASYEFQEPRPSPGSSSRNRWVPKVKPAFPSLADLAIDDGYSCAKVTPVPFPLRPQKPKSRSHTLRERFKKRMQICRVAVGLISTVNSLDKGLAVDHHTRLAAKGSQMTVEVTAAGRRAMHSLLKDATLVARERRSLGLTGAHLAAPTLLKTSLDDGGYLKITGVKQVPLIADRIVEPSTQACVKLLDVLPPEDSLFYSKESNVIELTGKSQATFREIEARYAFVGGDKQQYLDYLSRPEVAFLWEWNLASAARAFAGISAVLKKDGVSQRKLLMQCSADYL